MSPLTHKSRKPAELWSIYNKNWVTHHIILLKHCWLKIQKAKKIPFNIFSLIFSNSPKRSTKKLYRIIIVNYFEFLSTFFFFLYWKYWKHRSAFISSKFINNEMNHRMSLSYLTNTTQQKILLRTYMKWNNFFNRNLKEMQEVRSLFVWTEGSLDKESHPFQLWKASKFLLLEGYLK